MVKVERPLQEEVIKLHEEYSSPHRIFIQILSVKEWNIRAPFYLYYIHVG